MSENSLIILVGKSETLRNGDVYYPFRQDSDFLLLTGLNVPDLVLLWSKKLGKMTWILYSDPISDKERLWGTSRLDFEELSKKSGISEVRETRFYENDITAYSDDAEKIFLKKSDKTNGIKWITKFSHKFCALEDILMPLRMHKTIDEISSMRKAIEVTKTAFQYIEARIETYQYEREIEADIAMIYRKYGSSEAYPSIVSSGPNTCILHSMKYDRKLEKWDIILIDAGAEYEGYAADITRIFSYGEISERKKEIYHHVREIHDEALEKISVWRTWDEHEALLRTIVNSHLISLWLMSKDANGVEKEMISRKYFPHRMSHFLGLDVHDTWEKNTVLAPNMVITCEPGIYIPEEGIGVRLEDDILITDGGYENLSVEIPL